MQTEQIPFWMAVAMGALSTVLLPVALVVASAVARLFRRWRRRTYRGALHFRGP